MEFIQSRLSPLDTAGRAALTDAEFARVRDADLTVLIRPYLLIGLVIIALFLLIRFVKMPANADQSHKIDFLPTLRADFPDSSLPRRSDRAVLLHRRADHVLDLHHPVRHPDFSRAGDG